VEEARRWFEQLAVGGRVVMPFAEAMWSPGYGSLIDRFGVPWMINVTPGPEWKPSPAP